MTEILTVKLSSLKPDEKNARKHSSRNIAEVARSIEQFGQHRPFVVQRGTDRILVGNGMYEAMKKLGKEEGLVLYVDDDDVTAARRALADNRTGELAEWDFDVLKDIVSELGAEPDVPGWSDEELLGTVASAEDEVILRKEELRPYKKVHYLISFDINLHDGVVKKIKEIGEIEGVEVDSTLN